MLAISIHLNLVHQNLSFGLLTFFGFSLLPVRRNHCFQFNYMKVIKTIDRKNFVCLEEICLDQRENRLRGVNINIIFGVLVR